MNRFHRLEAVLLMMSMGMGAANGQDARQTYLPVAELPAHATAAAPNLDLNPVLAQAAEQELPLSERDILAAVNRWHRELFAHNETASCAYMLAMLLDPVTTDLRTQFHELIAGCASPEEKIARIREWTMEHMSHTQFDPKFEKYPGNDPWGLAEGGGPTYRKLLPSEMHAMAFHTGHISGKCMTLAHLLGAVFIQMGVAPEDVLYLHLQTGDMRHGVAMLRYDDRLFAINNQVVMPVPFREGTNPQPLDLVAIYNHDARAPCHLRVPVGSMDSTLLVTSERLVDGFLDDQEVPRDLLHRPRVVDCDLRDPVALAEQIFTNPGSSPATSLARYAYQSLHVKHPGYYLTASLRTSAPRELAAQLSRVPELFTWIREHVADGSIFPDGPTRLMTADQVLVFQQGSPKDKAVLAYTLLTHKGHEPTMIITTGNAYVRVNDELYSLQTCEPVPDIDEDARIVLKEQKRSPGLAAARRHILELANAGQGDAAVAALEAATENYPDAWQIHEDWSRFHSATGRTDLARADLLRAQALDPQSAERLNSLAWMALKAGDPQAAMAHCLEGLALEPENGYLKSNLVQGYIWSGQIERARSYIDAQDRVALGGKPFRQVVVDDIKVLGGRQALPAGAAELLAALGD